MEQVKNFIRVEYQGQLVLTYKQVATGLDCTDDQLRSLFRNHKDDFTEGEHFFNVRGNELRLLKKVTRNNFSNMSNQLVGVTNYHADSPLSFAKGAKSLKLWTKRGVARLSKLIDTPQAWELFTAIEKAYFDTQTVLEPVQSSLPLPEPVEEPAIVDKACVYVFRLGNDTTKIGVTADLVDRARGVERSSGSKVVRIHNSDFVDRELALKLEKSLHNKFSSQRLEGEFFSVTFEAACRELERCLAELHLFEPLALPDVDLADKLLAVADRLDPSPERQRVLLHVANLLVGQDTF